MVKLIPMLVLIISVNLMWLGDHKDAKTKLTPALVQLGSTVAAHGVIASELPMEKGYDYACHNYVDRHCISA